MEKGPIFEWSPVNIILDEQQGEGFFDNLINDLLNHHNYDDDSNYVPDDSGGDDNSLGSWEIEQAAMYEEEVMIVTDDDISKQGDISDREYSSNESKEEKIGGESEVEEGSDDCGD